MEEPITFQDQIEDCFLPHMREFELTKMTVLNGLGDKAEIKRDKHGYYSIKYTYIKEQA